VQCHQRDDGAGAPAQSGVPDPEAERTPCLRGHERDAVAVEHIPEVREPEQGRADQDPARWTERAQQPLHHATPDQLLGEAGQRVPDHQQQPGRHGERLDAEHEGAQRQQQRHEQ
jgi:hypothetical protein